MLFKQLKSHFRFIDSDFFNFVGIIDNQDNSSPFFVVVVVVKKINNMCLKVIIILFFNIIQSSILFLVSYKPSMVFHQDRDNFSLFYQPSWIIWCQIPSLYGSDTLQLISERNKEFNIFPESISRKLNVISQQEFTLVYFEAGFQYFRHYITRTPKTYSEERLLLYVFYVFIFCFGWFIYIYCWSK